MTDQSTVAHWYIARDGKQTGPISDLEITTIAGRGYFKDRDLVWRAGLAEWQPALSLFPPTSSPPPPPPQDSPALKPAATFTTSAPRSSRDDPVATTGRRSTVTPAAARALDPRPETAARPTRPPGPSAEFVNPSTMPNTRAPEPLPRWPAPAAQQNPSRLPLNAPGDPRTLDPVLRPQFQPKAAISADRPAGSSSMVAPRATIQPPPRTNWRGVAALCVGAAAVTTGVWIAAYPGMLRNLKSASLSSMSPAHAISSPAATPSSDSQIAMFDDRLQRTAHWPVIKREFPDWYGDRLREAAKLKGEQKSDDDIGRILAEELVGLRRQNANEALAASAPKLKALASAFLENLKQLKAASTSICFDFISHGETTPGVIGLLLAATDKPPLLQVQVAAIFDAIGEGRRNPTVHERPQKADYDVLMTQLGTLGWTQADVATFANPNELARAAPERVCQMVQDWFVAHISIPDAAVQERLLSETLRPVVAG